MNGCFLLPHAGKADTFCIAQKVSKNASFHKAIAKHRSFSNQNAFSIADGEVKFEI